MHGGRGDLLKKVTIGYERWTLEKGEGIYRWGGGDDG